MLLNLILSEDRGDSNDFYCDYTSDYYSGLCSDYYSEEYKQTKERK